MWRILAKKNAIIIAVLVFLILSFIVNIMYDVHKQRYISSPPDDNHILVRIKYDIDRIKEYGSVGNEWEYNHLLNNQEFKDGEVLNVNVKDPLSIKTRIVEYDKIPDIGESISRCKYDNYKSPIEVSQHVRVTERGGKKYAGSFVDFEVVYTIERVLPKNMSFWDVFFYTSNALDFLFCICLIVGQLICVGIAIRFIINKRFEV